MDIRSYFRKISTETAKRMQIVEDALKKSPSGRMREDRHVNKYYLIQDYYEKGKRHTYSLTKDNEMLNRLIKKELYQKELESLNSIKKVLDYAQCNIVVFDVNKAIAEIMARYPHLPEERILAALGSQASEWANAAYERSTYRQEDLKQITTRGLKVRSKSEAMIAEKLYQYNQQFRYEQVLRVNDFSLVPDFTIRRSDGKLFYWEHMGLTSNRVYLDRQMQKLQQYASVSIVPWDNLIITFDNESGMIDLRRVEFEIQNRLLV